MLKNCCSIKLVHFLFTQTLVHKNFFAIWLQRILLHLSIIYIHFHHFCMSEHMIFRHFFWFDCVWLSPFQDFYELHKCLYEIWCVLFGLLGRTTKLESLLNGLRKSPKALMQLECSFGCWVVKSLSNYNSAESKYTFSIFWKYRSLQNFIKCFLSKCRLSDHLFGIIVQCPSKASMKLWKFSTSNIVFYSIKLIDNSDRL